MKTLLIVGLIGLGILFLVCLGLAAVFRERYFKALGFEPGNAPLYRRLFRRALVASSICLLAEGILVLVNVTLLQHMHYFR